MIKNTFTIVAVIFTLGCIFSAIGIYRNAHMESPAPIQTAAVPVETPPTCTHQNCFERASGFYCDHPGNCSHYTVEYQRHCDCDQWAPKGEVK